MNLVRRKGQVVYEDLLRELEVIERRLLPEDSGAAMSLMVLESKLRERFQTLDMIAQGRQVPTRDTFGSVHDEINALIPRDLPAYPYDAHLDGELPPERGLETVAVAAVLALVTACAVFGLASAIQMALAWLA